MANLDELTADTLLTKSEAVRVTNTSQTKFSNENLLNTLREGGAKVDGTGSEWEIPAGLLVQEGLLNSDFTAPPKKARAPRGSKSNRSSAPRRNALEKAQADLDNAQATLEKQSERLAEAKARVKDAQKRVDAAVKEQEEFASRERETLEAQIREAQERLAALTGGK